MPLAFISITVLLTYLTLIFGELVPKRFAMKYSIPFALRIMLFIRVLSILALPIIKLLSVSAAFVLKLLRFKDDGTGNEITRDELRHMVEASGEKGHIAESEQDMIENIFTFDRLTAGDICTHRVNVVALPIDMDNKTLVNMLSGEFYTRLPVYEHCHFRGLGGKNRRQHT